MTESDDQLIMKATIDTDNAFPYPLLPTMTLSVRDGLLVHMPFIYDDTAGVSASVEPDTIKLGEYPRAQQLRSVGIGAYPSSFGLWGDHMSATLAPFGYCTPL